MRYENLIAEYAEKQKELCYKHDILTDDLFQKYGVNRGLRDQSGKGVLTGLTNISKIVAFNENGEPCDGQLWYRGYSIKC